MRRGALFPDKRTKDHCAETGARSRAVPACGRALPLGRRKAPCGTGAPASKILRKARVLGAERSVEPYLAWTAKQLQGDMSAAVQYPNDDHGIIIHSVVVPDDDVGHHDYKARVRPKIAPRSVARGQAHEALKCIGEAISVSLRGDRATLAPQVLLNGFQVRLGGSRDDHTGHIGLQLGFAA